MKPVLLLATTLLFLLPLAAAANQMPRPKVDFSADTTLEADRLAMTGKIYHTRDRKRIEQHLQDLKLVIIARYDRKIGWMILDDQHSYLEMSLDDTKQKSLDLNDCDAVRKPVKEETVNGVRTVKSRVTLSCPDGTSYEGSMWATPDNIIVRMDAVATSGTESYPFRLDLKNLHIGRQDEKRFELPSGYRKLELGGMLSVFGEILKSMPNREIDTEWQKPLPAAAGAATEMPPELKELQDLPGF